MLDDRRLAQLKRNCLFDEQVQQEFFLNPIKQNFKYSRYFNSIDPELNSQNILQYLYYFYINLTAEERGKIQDRIPIAINSFLGTREKGVPDLVIVMDLLFLTAMDVINLKELKHQSENLYQLANCLNQSDRKIRELFSEVGFLTDEQAQYYLDNGFFSTQRSQVRSRLFFNLGSIFDKKHLSDIKYLYQLVDVEKLKAITLEKCQSRVKDIEVRITNLLKHTPLSLNIRSYANIMLFLDKAVEQKTLNEGFETEFNYIKALPSVAQYLFGVKEPGEQIRKEEPFKRKHPKRVRERYFTRENKKLEKLLVF